MSSFELEDLRASVEAMLFVTDDAVSPATLASCLNVEENEIIEALESLEAVLAERKSGLTLRKVTGGYRLFTHPSQHDLIERYVISWDTRKLSQAALETLAIIAYYQPATRNTVNSIRGVNSDSVVSSLVEKGLIAEVGRDSNAGNAILFGTTSTFLDKFGLMSKKDLPSLEEFAPDEESASVIRERLSAHNKETNPTFMDSLYPAEENDAQDEADDEDFSDEVPDFINQ